MKKTVFLLIFSVSILLGAGVSAFAQNTTHVETQITEVAATSEVNTAEPTGEEWINVLKTLPTQGAGKPSVVLWAMFAVQALLLVARSAFTKLSASAKYWTVGGLSLVAALLVEISKAPAINLQVILTALMTAPVIAAFNVLLHQGLKLNVNKKV